MGLLQTTSVSLRFFGDDLEPEHVTLALGYLPDTGLRLGEVWRTRKGAERVARTGSWIRRVPRRQPGALDAQLMELLAPLTEDMVVWQRLTTQFRADVFCGLFLEDYNDGANISAQALLALGSRNLPLSLDIYAA